MVAPMSVLAMLSHGGLTTYAIRTMSVEQVLPSSANGLLQVNITPSITPEDESSLRNISLPRVRRERSGLSLLGATEVVHPPAKGLKIPFGTRNLEDPWRDIEWPIEAVVGGEIMELHVGESIGAGAHAEVKTLHNHETNRSYAGKLVSLLGDSAEVELQKAVQSNEHIVKVLGNIDLASGFQLIVLELLPDGDLFDKIKSRRLQPHWDYEVQDIFAQLVRGVKCMHQRGVAHGDLKPENVLCDGRTSPLTVKVGDFGFAFRFDTALGDGTKCVASNTRCQRHTNGRGSWSYASPEVYRAISKKSPYHGPEADVWSLGVMLYTMLLGYTPWKGPGPQVLSNMMKRRQVYENVHGACCQQLIQHMLLWDVRERYTIEQVDVFIRMQDGIKKDNWCSAPCTPAHPVSQSKPRSPESVITTELDCSSSRH